MITIFCDFGEFSVKTLAFFSKNKVIIKLLQKVTLVWSKNANIFAIFSAKIFSNS
jgi:hypothetical protein